MAEEGRVESEARVRPSREALDLLDELLPYDADGAPGVLVQNPHSARVRVLACRCNVM